MYRIDNYRKRAVDKIIPYLIEFPQIIKIIEMSADRYQAIEDLLWKVVDNFRVDDARGVFLNALAHNEVIDLIYTDKANDAFTYGSEFDVESGKVIPSLNAYGTGHYYSQSSYVSGTRKSLSEDKLIRAIKAKIIQNNTNCTIADFLEAVKLMYNAEKVIIQESYPLNVDITLKGSNLELSSSGNYENIKKILPACVNLRHIYLDHGVFDLFKYNKYSSYGDARYPILIGDGVERYNFIPFSITLNSEFNEYIKTNYNKLDNNHLCYITGEFTQINDNAVIFSSSDDTNLSLLKFLIQYKEDGKPYFACQYGGEEFISNEEVLINTPYSFIIYNSNNKLTVHVIKDVIIRGENSNIDIVSITKNISLKEATITIDNYETVNGDIYINCVNHLEQGTQLDVQDDFADFTYYAIIFGQYNQEDYTSEINEYYVSCYGEKHILFNCLENKNHLYINTQSPLITNLTTKQNVIAGLNYLNYKYFHSNGKYVYFDGDSNIVYKISNQDLYGKVDNFDVSFDFCSPIQIKEGVILSGFVNDNETKSQIGFNENKKLFLKMNIGNISSVDQLYDVDENKLKDADDLYLVSTPTITRVYNLSFNYTFNEDKFYKVRIKYENRTISLIVNDEIKESYIIESDVYDLPQETIIGSDRELTSFYKGFVKNVKVLAQLQDNTNGSLLYSLNLDIPLDTTIKANTENVTNINFGARFLTTPQLITDTNNVDIYGNDLIRNKV